MKSEKCMYVIDDDEIFQFIISKMINDSKSSVKVQFFLNGKEAIDYLQNALDAQKDVPDVILLDLKMPVMDGWQFLDKYKSLKQKTKKRIDLYIVTSSTYGTEEVKKRAKSYDVISGFLVKPLDANMLANVLG